MAGVAFLPLVAGALILLYREPSKEENVAQ